MSQQKTAASRYAALATDREIVLSRARDASRFTIPSLIPAEGFNESTELELPYQSLGARGVNNLANKLLLALLPPSSTFFRLTFTEKIKQEINALDQKAVAAFDSGLSKMEQEVLKEIERIQVRVHAAEAFKHLIVAGNVLLHFDKKSNVRLFTLPQYVVKRDPAGAVLEIVVKESVSPDALPDSVRETVYAKLQQENKKEEVCDLYTRIWLENGQYRVVQEIKDLPIPESIGTYPKDKLPWLALRWTRIDGQSYGRSHCEEYLGDLAALDRLEKAVLDVSAIAARLLFLANPAGLTDKDEVTNADNGACIDGVADDITVLQANKFADLQVTVREIDRIEQRLNYAFLMHTAIQRNGERVTAEEIRYMAGELENTLGGVYSVMSSEFQLPMVKLVMAHMASNGSLPPLPKDGVQPAIVTGLDALGRSQELMRLDAFLKGAIETYGELVIPHINMSEYLSRRATALGIDATNLIKSEEEMAQAQETMMNQSMMEKAAPNMVKGFTDMAMQQAEPQATE